MKKRNLLALILFIATVVAVFMMDTRITRKIQGQVLSLLSPFTHAGSSLEKTVLAKLEDNNASQLNPIDLKRDLDAMQIEVESLRIVSQKYQQTLEENNRLREIIEFKKVSPFKMNAARVVKRVSSTWWNTLIIDKGSLDNLATDAPVISASGLIGKTGKMESHMAEVILLTDEMCRVSAKVEGTLEQGILSGERAGLELRSDLRLRFLSRDANLIPGTRVISTGEGGIFPAGLLIGKVKRFENKDITGEAIVEPAVDFSAIDHVFVVVMQEDEEASTDAPAAPAAAQPTATPGSANK
jgi:rod shape-determining protein MreC